jgi:hypothetical protein
MTGSPGWFRESAPNLLKTAVQISPYFSLPHGVVGER